MRGGKDENKQMDPLFPRLHINDAERGGPRAPPRNKMALCEQVNIQSQRFSSGSMSLKSLSSSNSTNLVPSTSLSHIHCHKKNVFSLFCSSPESSHMAERLNFNPSGGMILNTKYSEFQILSSGDYQSFSARRPLKMTAECRSFRPCSFNNSMSSSAKKHGNEDDIRFTYFGQREKTLNCGSVGIKMEKEKVSSSSLSFSGKPESPLEIQEKEMGRNDVKSREHSRNQAEDKCEVSEMSDDNAEKLHPDRSTEEKVLVDTAPSVIAIYGTCESGNRAILPINHTKITSWVNDISTSHDTCAQTHQECRSFPIITAIDDNMSRDPERYSRKRNFSSMESPSCSSPPTGENNRMPNRLESVNECPKVNDCASSRVGDVERCIAISDNLVVDSNSSLRISPYDVVGVIGPKFFWSVRSTIAHQQRIFALQIFELHRLIKVQKLIARSPEMLFEDKFIFSKLSVNFSPEKKLQLENFSEPPALCLKPLVDSQKPKPCLDYVAEEAHRQLPPPTYETENRHVTPKFALKPYSGAVTAMSFAPDAKFGPWCFPAPPAPGNQWLIPVRSPFEGLIYKPCAGPFLPTAGRIAPVYGGCGTMSLTRMDGDYASTAYGIPASNQHGIGIYTGPASLGRSSCFQTYALPPINTSNSSSAVEQTGPFADNHGLSTYDINYVIPHQRSYDIMSQRSGIMTDSARNLQVSKGSDFEGSTASNPDERVQGEVLSLFPRTPTIQMAKHPVQNRQIQVIKVVPHNPKSASESAARIFQSIQEERKQHE